jgi:hypothetical protein
MQEELKYLLELSDCDKTVYNLRSANVDLPKRINVLKNKIASAKQKLNEVCEAIEQSETKIKDNNDFIVTENQALDSSKLKLDKISTNKEYDAIHTEIATHKRNIEDSQANALHFQQVLENLNNDKQELEEYYSSIETENLPELESLNKELDSLEGKISTELEKGEAPKSKISKKIISVYERVKKRRKTPYVVSVINWNNRVCEVCNRTQPPQRINELNKSNAIINCETCGSILIWKNE